MPSAAAIEIVNNYSDVKAYLPQIRKVADSNRQIFGFLPFRAYEQMAPQGKVFVARLIGDKQYVGHLLTGGAFPTLRIFQLYVAPKYRGSGIGRALIDNLIEYGEQRHYLAITARVADDLTEANRAWDRLGFHTTRRIQGGKTTKRILNIRVRQLSTPDLFAQDHFSARQLTTERIQYRNLSPIEAPSYAVDINVILDLVDPSRRDESVVRVFHSALISTMKLFVTGEFEQELERSRTSDTRDPMIELVQNLPRLPQVDESELEHLPTELLTCLFGSTRSLSELRPRERSDLNHLAQAIHHRLSGFITRDKVILRKNSSIAERWDFRIVSPDDFIEPSLDPLPESVVEIATNQHFATSTEFSERQRPEVERFLKDIGVDAQQVRTIWAPGPTDFPRRRYCMRVGPNIVGTMSIDHPSTTTGYARVFLFIDESVGLSEMIADHFIELANRYLLRFGPTTAQLNLSPEQTKSKELALSRGFRTGSSTATPWPFATLYKLVFGPVVTRASWPEFKSSFKEVIGYSLPGDMPRYDQVNRSGIELVDRQGEIRFIKNFELEHLASPVLLLFPSRQGAIIPILPGFAEELIGEVDNQIPLLPGREALLKSEKAYYRRPRRQRFLSPGTPLVFYVSGGSKGPGKAIGCGRITGSSIEPIEQARVQYYRQGVLDVAELSKMGDTGGRVQIITFDNFKPFHHPVTFGRLKELGAISDINLVTAENLSPTALGNICAEGFSEK